MEEVLEARDELESYNRRTTNGNGSINTVIEETLGSKLGTGREVNED